MSGLRVVVVMSMILTLAGCGGSNFEYGNNKDVKPGPGLFSGDDAGFTLIKSDLKPSAETKFGASRI